MIQIEKQWDVWYNNLKFAWIGHAVYNQNDIVYYQHE